MLLGSLGTLVSAVSSMPHLAHALRNRKPQGSTFAWFFGAFSSGIWFVYGFAGGGVLVAAPGFVTIPIGVGMGLWCHRVAQQTAMPALANAPAPVMASEMYVPEEWEHLTYASAGDTLKMPRIA